MNAGLARERAGELEFGAVVYLRAPWVCSISNRILTRREGAAAGLDTITDNANKRRDQLEGSFDRRAARSDRG